MKSWQIGQAIIQWIRPIGFIILLFGTVTAHSATPTVTTESASEMTQNSAQLCATVSPNGDNTTVFFRYQQSGGIPIDITYDSTISGAVSNMTACLTVAGLTCNTQYEFQGMATNSAGTSTGFLKEFSTLVCPATIPDVITNNATNLSKTGATMSATINPNGATTTLNFDYGATINYGNTVSYGNIGSGTSTVNRSHDISGFDCGTTYHFRAHATNSAGTSYGNDQTLTTNDCQPGSLQFSSSSQSSVNEDSNTITMTVTRTNGSDGALLLNYATSNGTATAGSDYTIASDTLSWADGDTAAKTITINIIDDNQVESDETFMVSLSNVIGGASLGTSTVVVTLNDNDISSCSAQTDIPKTECDTLVALYNQTNGATWLDSATNNWTKTNTPCSWTGVFCSNGHLTQITRTDNNLVGTLPDFSALTELQLLDLSTNQLTGSLPDLSALTNLQTLSLPFNQLSGTIPNLSTLTGLQTLNLSGNQLSGSIPNLGTLKQLQFLSLYSNQLSGEIPMSLASLTQISSLDLVYNQLTASDATLFSFLNNLNPNWKDTQTVPPSHVTATAIATDAIRLTWTPIAYASDGGYYHIKYGTQSGGPYPSEAITANKQASSLDVTGLSLDTSYYFVVETFTPAHGSQQNALTSKLSAEASATTEAVAAAADLSLIKTDSVDSVQSGASFNYTLTVQNHGPNDATQLKVTDTLHNSLIYNRAIGDGWTCNENSGIIICELAALIAGATTTITIHLTAPTTAQTVDNTASVTGSETDPDISNNSATDSMAVVTQPLEDADLSITLSDSSDSVFIGAPFSYTLTVNNSGPATANDVQVVDTLSDGVTFNSTSGTDWSCNESAGTVTCTLPNLPIGMANPITVNVTAPTTDGSLTNEATVSATTADSNTSNNKVTEQIVIAAVPPLCQRQNEIPEAQCNTLVAIYNSTGGLHWTDSPANNWTQTDTPCSWTGIQCANGQVTQLQRNNQQMIGTLPELSALSALEYLVLYDNQLTGPLPDLTPLTRLQHISLHNNQFTGAILNVSTLTQLQSLDLGGNQLEGTIPDSIGTLTQVTELYLWENQLSGDIPATLAQLSQLTQLDLGYNKLTASDTALLAFLNDKDADWAATQTVPPTQVKAAMLSADTVQLTWTPIAYTGDEGHYQVKYATQSGGPYTSAPTTTADKPATSYQVTGLSLADTQYCFVVETYTPAHGSQQNALTSDLSQETCTVVVQAADLSLTKTASLEHVQSGASFSYSLTVHNHGLNDAMAIEVTDELPDGLIYNQATAPGWQCQQNNGNVSCQLATLSSGATAEAIIIQVTAPTTNTSLTLDNIATVTSSTSDSNSSNNQASHTLVVIPSGTDKPLADLAITQTDWPDSVVAGERMTYSLIVTNHGPDEATEITVVDTLSTEVTSISASSTDWVCQKPNVTDSNNQQITCTLASLLTDMSANMVLNVIIPSTSAEDSLSHLASVSATIADPNQSNNSVSGVAPIIVPLALKTEVLPLNSGLIQRVSDKAEYLPNETVLLTATRLHACYKFSHWSGACQGAEPVCTLLMDAEKNTTAHFQSTALAFTVSADNGGSVAIVPEQTSYSCGETVTLTADCPEQYRFLGWLGDVAGEQNPLTLVLRTDMEIKALCGVISDLTIEPLKVYAKPKQENLKFQASGGTGQFLWATTGGDIRPNGSTATYQVPEEGVFYVWVTDGVGFAWSLVDATSPEVPVLLQVAPAALNLQVGDKQQLSVRGYYINGNSIDIIADSRLRSENTEIVQVDSQGQITARAPGETQLVVSYRDLPTKIIPITVRDELRRLKVEPDILILHQQSTQPVVVYSVSQSGAQHVVETAQLMIRDDSIATVDSQQQVTAGNQTGATWLDVKAGEFILSIPVVVRLRPKLNITPETATVEKGETVLFSVVGGQPPYQMSAEYGLVDKVPGVLDYQFVYHADHVAENIQLMATDSAIKPNQAAATVNVVIPLTVTPKQAVVTAGDPVDLRASGGSGQYSWSTTQGQLFQTQGEYTSYIAPQRPGLHTVTVTDELGNSQDILILVGAELLLSQQQLFLAPTQTAQIQILGGVPPYPQPTITGGESHLKKALLAADQVRYYIDYTAPEVAGFYTLMVTDSQGQQVSADITVALDLLITPVTGRVNAGETLTFQTAGGIGTKRWFTSQGDFDQFEGEVVVWTAPKHFGTAYVNVLDAAGAIATATIEISSPGLAITPSVRHIFPGKTAEFTVSGGAAPYDWIMEQGDYVSIAEDTIIYTAPAVKGSYQITVHDAFQTPDGTRNTAKALAKVYSTQLLASPKTLYAQPDEKLQITLGGGTGDYTLRAQVGRITKKLTLSEDQVAVSTDYIAPAHYQLYDTITVQDSAGNIATIDVEMAKPTVLEQAKRADIIRMYVGPDKQIDHKEMQQAVTDFFDGQRWLDRTILYEIAEQYLK